MAAASEELPHICGDCGTRHGEKGYLCEVCKKKEPTTKGHIPSRDEEWSATTQNATRYFLLETLGITEDTPHRLCDLAAMVARQHTAVLGIGSIFERDLEFTKVLLTKAIELGVTQAATIDRQQKTIAQYGGILAKAVERLGA